MADVFSCWNVHNEKPRQIGCGDIIACALFSRDDERTV